MGTGGSSENWPSGKHLLTCMFWGMLLATEMFLRQLEDDPQNT